MSLPHRPAAGVADASSRYTIPSAHPSSLFPSSYGASIPRRWRFPENPIHKRVRRSRFSKDDDLVHIREVSAAKSHIAPNSKVRDRFEIAAFKPNAKKRLRYVETWKAVQDRYKSLQDYFVKYENIECRLSGVEREMGEAEELLSAMREARVDFEGQRNTKRKRAMDEDERRERLGAIIWRLATERAPSPRDRDRGTGAAVVDKERDGKCEGVDASMIGSARSMQRRASWA